MSFGGESTSTSNWAVTNEWFDLGLHEEHVLLSSKRWHTMASIHWGIHSLLSLIVKGQIPYLGLWKSLFGKDSWIKNSE
jgi:hypothetical protein